MTAQVEWTLATLQDAADELDALIGRIQKYPEEIDEAMLTDLASVYAKLNYAANTAELGDEALSQLKDDDLVAWPAAMPFKKKRLPRQA